MTIKEWDGKGGVPPIWSVCEYYCSERGEWRMCEIVAYYFASVVAIDVIDCSAVCLHNGLFRPIKTPEQIAVEERSAAIKEMFEVASGFRGSLDISVIEVVVSLYDAGYRRTGVEKCVKHK